MRVSTRSLDRIFRRRGLGQVKSLEQKIKDLFKDGSQGVWYDPSDFNSSWRRNLLTKTEQFDDVAVWGVNGNVSIAANSTVAPDGTTSADTLTRGATNASESMLRVTTSQVANTSYTLSVYAKAGSAGALLYIRNLAVNGGLPSGLVTFSLSGDNVVTEGSAYTNKTSITPVGNGWYRCSIHGTTGASIANNLIDIGCSTNATAVIGTAGAFVYIWGAQLELGTTASEYQKITDGVADYYVYGSPLPVLYQDAAGTTPVTALEQPVGLMLDKSRGGRRELSVTGWAKTSGDGTVTVDGGTITITGATTTTRVDLSAVGWAIGDHADITITGSVGSATGQTVFIGGGNAYTALSGTNTFRNVISSSTLLRLQIATGSATFVVSSRGYTPGNHAYHTPGDTTTRPVVSCRINLLTKTEIFDDAAWSKLNCSIVPNAAIAPDGALTARKLVMANGISPTSAAADGVYQSLAVSSGNYGCLIYAKAAEFTSLRIRENASVGAFLTVDLLTGAITNPVPAQFASATATDAGNGWWRVQFLSPAGMTNANKYSIRVGSTGDGTSGIYIWGASLVPADLSALPYQRVNTTTDYDSDPSKFPTFLRCDGVNDSLQTNAIDFTGTDKMFVGAAVRKLSDGAYQIVAELSASASTNNGAFVLLSTSGAGTAASNALSFGLRGTASAGYDATAFPVSSNYVASTQLNIAGAAVADEINPRVNGVVPTLTSTGAANAGTGNFGNHKLYLFMRAGTTLPFNGWFYGSVIKGATLSASQIALVERYLAGKTKTVTLA